MNIEILSYRNVFFDGIDKLHPAFRIGKVLFAISSKEPQMTPFIPVKVDSIHFKGKESYLTTAYNQNAVPFNSVSGGVMIVNDTEREFISRFLDPNEDLNDYIIN